MFFKILVVMWGWYILNELSNRLLGGFIFLITPSTGPSMMPAIPSGTTLSLAHYPLSIEPGDIITYEADDGGFVEHRVMDRSGDRLLMKGDNNSAVDGWYDVDRVRSKSLQLFGRAVYIPISPASINGTFRKL